MRKLYKSEKWFICIMLLQTITITGFCQNMNNPYSVYGIGDIDNKIYNRTSGMAGTGLALKSSAYLIDNNPAGLTGLTRSFYLAHVAVTGRSSTFSGNPIDASNSKNKDMWIKRFALAVKINKFWASSIGFGQFSNVNYKFTGTKFIEGGTSIYQTELEGDGGLNDYYWTNAISIGKHLSLGIKSSVIAGAINQSEILSDEALQTVITTKQQDYIGDLRFQGGLIYETKLSKAWNLSLGARYAPKTKFTSQRTLDVTENGTELVKDDYVKSDFFYLPHTVGGGIALKHNNKTTFAGDYTYEDWSSISLKKTGYQLINSHRASAGVEFARFKSYQGFQAEHRFFQAGVFFEHSYLQIRKTPIQQYGFTGGMGGVLGNNLLYSISLEAGSKGTRKANLIKESYVGFTLNLSYRDFLLSKGRKYE